MAEPNDQIRSVLEKIRDDAQQALSLLTTWPHQRALSWECAGCGHVKHFTRPVPVEVASPCPKCRSESFHTANLMAVPRKPSNAVPT